MFFISFSYLRKEKIYGFERPSYLHSYLRAPTDRRGPVNTSHPRAAALEQPPREPGGPWLVDASSRPPVPRVRSRNPGDVRAEHGLGGEKAVDQVLRTPKPAYCDPSAKR